MKIPKGFPLPYFTGGEAVTGSLIPWVDQCGKCDLQCQVATPSQLTVCSYGVNYRRLDEETVLAGFLVAGKGKGLPAASKRHRSNKESVITIGQFDTAVQWLHEHVAGITSSEEADASKVRDSDGYIALLAEKLEPHIKSALAQFHDYRQLVARILANLMLILNAHIQVFRWKRRLKWCLMRRGPCIGLLD